MYYKISTNKHYNKHKFQYDNAYWHSNFLVKKPNDELTKVKLT